MCSFNCIEAPFVKLLSWIHFPFQVTLHSFYSVLFLVLSQISVSADSQSNIFVLNLSLLGLYEAYPLTRCSVCSSHEWTNSSKWVSLSSFISNYVVSLYLFINLSFHSIYSISIHCWCLMSVKKCPMVAVLLWTGQCKPVRWHKSLCTLVLTRIIDGFRLSMYSKNIFTFWGVFAFFWEEYVCVINIYTHIKSYSKNA